MSDTTLPVGLMMIHGNASESLRDVLIGCVQRYPLRPLEQEVVLVQSNGIGQWLKLALAADPADGGCGIAAATVFSFPARFVWEVYRAVLGPESIPESSPYDKSALAWRLMRVLPELLGEPVFQPLRRFLSEDADSRKRFQLAHCLADLYDQYQVYRADWLQRWVGGEDVIVDARGGVHALPPEQRWQAELWRRLRADVAARMPRDEAVGGGRAAVHAAFLERAAALRDAPRPTGVPRRVSVFGISAMPRQTLEVLAAIAQWAQVLVFVHNPCQHYWADIVSDHDLLRPRGGRGGRQPRKQGAPAVLAEDELHLHAHPLLAAWGKQGRDCMAMLEEFDDPEVRARQQSGFGDSLRIDCFVSSGGNTLLQRIQDDILDLVSTHEIGERRLEVDPDEDRSIRFHVAHGAQREVEILQDQLLAAFDADPTLRPRDVIVMVPDIDAYAPHIRAVFGVPARDDPRHIPFSVADQTRRHHDPLLNAVSLLLDLPRSRVTASNVLDLLEVPALRRRFGFVDTDLPLVQRWIRAANVRWGLHGEHRASLDLPRVDANAASNSWLFGLRRMLLGYALGFDAAAWHGIEPLGEVGGLDAARLGPLVALLARIEAWWQCLSTEADVVTWCDRLRRLKQDFFDVEEADEAYLFARLDSVLEQWQRDCEQAGVDEALPLSVVAEHWLSGVDAGGLSQRFFAGAVTFATLMPMRAIPFRQVCLLGMNDGDYPRGREPLDFDLMSREYRPGDRSRRDDDRYLFLEALLSARERLYISWVGRSITDNSERPPSVLVGQLRDHIRAGWRLGGAAGTGCGGDDDGGVGVEAVAPDRVALVSSAATSGETLLAAITWEHPLQPFSARYFPPGDAGQARALFTYAHEWRAGFDTLAHGESLHRTALLPPQAREEPVSLAELIAFVEDPVKAFFRQRLGVDFRVDEGAGDDIEPFELDGLERWRLQDELIALQADAIGRAQSLAEVGEKGVEGMQRRGDLAEGALGERQASVLLEPMETLFEHYGKALARWPHAFEREIELRFECTDDAGENIELVDWLGGLRGGPADPDGGGGGNDAVKGGDEGGDEGVATGRESNDLPPHLLPGAEALASVVLSSTDLVDRNGKYRREKLIAHWVRHLAFQVAVGPVTTSVMSKKGVVTLEPVERVEARGHLETLLRLRERGLREPLPLAVRSAFAMLVAGGTGAIDAAALEAARKTFYGSEGDGEVDRNPWLARAWPDFEQMIAVPASNGVGERGDGGTSTAGAGRGIPSGTPVAMDAAVVAEAVIDEAVVDEAGERPEGFDASDSPAQNSAFVHLAMRMLRPLHLAIPAAKSGTRGGSKGGKEK